MAAIDTTLTAPPATLDRTSGDAFDASMLTWLAWHNTQSTEYSTLITETNQAVVDINADVITTNTNATTSITQAGIATTKAAEAAADAATALSAPGTNATSTSSETVGSGAKTITVETGKSLVPGMYIIAADSALPAVNSMHGIITTYTTGTGVLNFTVPAGDFLGAGVISSWAVSISAPVLIQNDASIARVTLFS